MNKETGEKHGYAFNSHDSHDSHDSHLNSNSEERVRVIEYFKYLSQTGDSVSSLSARFQASPSIILEINEIEDPDYIVGGIDIKIPVRIYYREDNTLMASVN